MTFEGKTGLITGGCGGLGKALAEAFLAEGANVVVCDIRDKLISDFEEQVASDHGKRALALKCDITDDAALDNLFAKIKKTFSKLDFVVNCAGMMDSFDPVGEVARSMWDRVMALNLTAPAMVTQRAVRAMIEGNVKGSIVNIASIASVAGLASGVAYTTSKHGLIGLTKSTAAFYGMKAGIRCNAVLPGVMMTNIFPNLGANLNPEGFTMMRKHYPEELQQIVEVEKVAKMVVYLCSDAGDIMNGACISVDKGTLIY